MNTTINCANCAYNPNGEYCTANTLNKAKYKACVKQESELPNLAQINYAQEQKRKERTDEGFCPICTCYLMGTEGFRVCSVCGWRE